MKLLSFNKYLLDVAKRTPPERDRYVDFLRACSIIVVVLGHWLSAVVIKSDTGIRIYNAVGMISGMWLITWVLQVMPLFFFVGGFSNARALNVLKNKGKSIRTFYTKRAIRLLKPTIVFLLIWILIIALLILLLPDWKTYKSAIIATVGPLWFLAVYLFVTLIAPFMLKLHRMRKAIIPLILMVLTAGTDFIRFKFGIPWIAWLNVGFVWVFVHQLGFFYEDDTLVNLSLSRKTIIAIIGLVGLIILTNLGIYPRSMIGTGFEKISNMNPPTLCIVMLSLWLIGIAMLLRKRINLWLDRTGPWILVIFANTVIMTLYLWHLTAFTIAFLILHQFGLGYHTIDNIKIWWLERPAWIIIPGIILIGFINIFGRFESSGIEKGEKR
ncbi:MAG: acyltransferase family protein [bacterium]